MSSCPVCGKPVDPLRAPAVGVREGKVVPYCSKEHAAQAESGPVKLAPTKIVRLPSEAERAKVATPASGVVTAPAPKAESAPVAVEPEKPRFKRPDSVQIADTGTVDDYVTSDGSSKRIVMVVALLVLVGAAGAALYFLVLNKHDEAPPVAVVTHDASVAPPIDAAPVVTRETARARAEAVLRQNMGGVSDRVQQVAAAALARTGDKAALDALAAALAKESSEGAKVTLAYQLARGGDKRGTDALGAAIASPKRDVRLEAGKRLAMLGDKRAVAVLRGFIGYAEYKIDVASNLAPFGDADALKILQDKIADPAAQPTEKARATFALARAGKPNADELHRLLTVDGDNKFAALALARLHDAAARPLLEKWLGISELRVDAARGLRLLDPAADTTPFLAPLVAVLDASTKDTEQVYVAETLLLLAGEPAWSELE